MAASFVQEVAKNVTGGSTNAPAATLSATPTGGNTLLARIAANQTVSSVTDSKGNTWALDVTQTTSSLFWALASCTPTTPLVSGDIVTAHLAGATSFHAVVIDEWTNIAAFGGSTATTTGTSTNRTTNSVTVPDGAVVLGVWSVQVAEAAFVAGTNYTAFHTASLVVSDGGLSIEGEYQIDSGSGGSYSPNATGTSGAQRGKSAYYIAAGTVPINTVAPALSVNGSGTTLTCSTGTWTNTPTSYAYQWLKDSVAVNGATASTYVPSIADRGHSFTCTVTATNSFGNSPVATSSNSITAAAPTFAASGKLQYAPPAQNSPITVDLTATPGDYFATWTPGADYIVSLSPTVPRTGEIEVDANGARSVHIIGGVWALADGGTKNYHIHIHNLVGWAFIEGQEADMALTNADFLDISGGSLYRPDIYFQNSRLVNLTASDNTNHADIFQPQGLIGRAYVDKVTFSSNYQGFTVDTTSTGHAAIGQLKLSRVNSWFSSANATNPFTAHYWVNVAGTAGGKDSAPFPLVFDDVYCDLTRGAGRSAYSNHVSWVIFPSIHATGAGLANGGTLIDGGASPFTPGEFIGADDVGGNAYAWVSNVKMKVGGVLNNGSPSTGRSDVITDVDGSGSFVPPGIGNSYTTPGYLPSPRVGVAI